LKKQKAYRLYGSFYNMFRNRKLHQHDVFFVMTHDEGEWDNCGRVKKEIEKIYKEQGINAHITVYKRSGSLINMIFGMPASAFRLATSKNVFMDNTFLPLAFCNVRENQNIVQLWHGTGTIKRFGHDTTKGELLELEKKADSKITHLIVSSEYTGNLYSKVLGVDRKKVYVTGSPRADAIFETLEKRATEIAESVDNPPVIKNVLYAPTFRENADGTPSDISEVIRIIGELDEMICEINKERNTEIRLMVRLHPFLSHYEKVKALIGGLTYTNDVSFEKELIKVLEKTDLLITDYSSIAYDFEPFDRPMLFYAYDLEKFTENERGFYEKYEEFVPGSISMNRMELKRDIIKLVDGVESDENSDLDGLLLKRKQQFAEKAYKYRDTDNTKRVLELLETGRTCR